MAVQIRYRRADGPLNLLIDSTGIEFLGDSEWQARKHGFQGRRQSLPGRRMRAFAEWARKVHLAMDTATSDIRAVEFTPSSDGGSPVLPMSLDQIHEGEEIGTVTVTSHGLRVNPFPGNGRRLRHPQMPHRHLRPTRQCDHTDPQQWATVESRLPGRNRPQRDPARHPTFWPGVLEVLDGLPCQMPDRGKDALAFSLEPVVFVLLDHKAFGERIAARDPDSQAFETQFRVALMNRFSVLGTAEIVRVG